MTLGCKCYGKRELKLLWAQHGHDQVDEAGECNQADDDIFHGEKAVEVGSRWAYRTFSQNQA